MATYYSDIFSGLGRTTAGTAAGGTGGATISNLFQSTQNAHARRRTTIAHFRVDADEDLQTTDVLHMLVLKPMDRLVRLRLTCGDAGTTGDINIGLYTVKPDQGTLLFTLSDADLFASALDVNAAALTWSDVMHESGTVPINYIGSPMWEIANLGDGTFTNEEPDSFAISIAASEVTTADDLDFILVADYIAGD